MKSFFNEIYVMFVTLVFAALGVRIWLEGWPWVWE